MTNGFNEAWLKAHLAKRVSGRTVQPDMVQFTLEKPLPLLNVLLRTHWAKRRRLAKALSAEISAAAHAQLLMQPIQHAKVRVERHGIQAPDPDGLQGCVKLLLDVLQPRSDKHPHGLGFIWQDDPDHLTLEVVHVQAATRKDQKTVVRVEKLP